MNYQDQARHPFMSYGRLHHDDFAVTFLFAVFFLSTKGLNFAWTSPAAR